MPAGATPPRGPAKPPGPPPAKPPGIPPPAAAAASAASGVDPAAATTRVPGSEGDEAAYAEEWAGWTGGGWWRQESSTWDGGRGLDAGLSQTAPSYELLKTDGYRVFRRKLEVFERCCRKRGTTAISEGAFLVMNSLQGEGAEATGEIDLDLLETDEAFRPLFKVLDEYYKYDNQTELPARTDQFFGRFARQEKESMKLYCLRHQRDIRKLREVGMEIPDMLAGWHLLTRAAIPPSGAAQIRSQCVDGLSWQKVKKALLDTYGAEGLPDKRDIKRVEKMLLGQNTKDDAHYTSDYEWREELPQDVGGAQLACDEAYLSAKKRVAEIAKSRGSTQQHGQRFKRFRHGGFTRPETESGNMVEDVETLECANSTEEVFLLTVGKGISDGGATRPVMGDKVWAQWEELLRVKQLLHEVKYEKSDRRFRFGDGKTLEAKKAVTLSVWPFGIKKQVAIHLVEGWTPLLIARPCMEERGLIQDYRAGTFMMKDLPDKGWMKSERDEKGHFIIDLLGSAGKEADDAMNEGAPTDGEESSDDSTDKDSEGSSAKGETDDRSDSSVPDADAYYLETVPEFYDIGSDDEALTTEGFSDMDADTYSDLILALEQAETDMKDTLRGPRERVVWEVFVDQGALSEELLEFPQVKVIQFRLGAKFEIKGKFMPYQKPTRLQSTNKEFAHHMNVKCSCTEEHVVLRGKLAQQAQNYPRPMARRMAYLIAYQGMADDIKDINTAEEVSKDIDAIEYTDVMQELMKRFNVSTIRAVKRAHISLGHPSNTALATAVKHAKAPAEWLQCAKLLQCEVCPSGQRPRAVRVAVLTKAKRFNEVVNNDVYYVTWKNKERKISAMMDEFTRYEVDYPIAKETFKKEVKLFQKLWLSWAGKPDAMRMDMAGSHTSRKMHQWTSKHNITLDLIPKGARHKPGLMERNHAVRREQLSKYHLQFPGDSLKTALRMTASQRNILRNVHGYSPATLVLGTQPKVPGALCVEDFGLAEQAALVDPKSEVHEMMVRRAAAGTAFIEANCSRAVRAALLARSWPTRRECQIGEWVYFWRPEMSTGLEKCHWHGLALVVAVESKVNEDDVMHTSVAWVTHGRTIYRCTVEQLRPELSSETREREGRREDPDSLLSTIEKLRRALRRTKGTCSFSDLAEGGQRPQYDDTLDDMGAQQPGAQGHRDGDPVVHIEAMAKRSIEEAEKLDGIPLAKRARMSWARLAPQQEREQFYAAKLEALEVFNKNDGWEPIDEAEVDPAARCPLRFLLKWKVKDGQRVANARVLYQGFKHRDVAEGQLDKEAPTLSRLGRHTVMLWAALRKWRLFAADVKSAFLQAEDVSAHGIKLYASPTKEMRDMLVHQIGLQPGQLLKMIKPCFGDPRSPKLWHHRSDAVTREIGFRNHWLEECLLLSLRAARPSDDPLDVCSFDGQTFVVDGLIGKHVDDFIGCGENVSCEDDLHAKLDDTECFQARLGMLNEKFKFGKWEFGPSLVFTGGEVEQSLSTHAITIKFEKYLHAVKPITVEKHRRADPTSALSPKELTNFRTLDGQLQWPAAQGVIIAAATVSFRAAATGHATMQDLLDANKKNTAPEGGYQIFVGPEDELNAGTPTPFVAMEWASKNLARLCRSSLSAEAQAAAMGADSLMWLKAFLALSLRPDLGHGAAMTYLGESPFITDAKCLYDASRSATAGLGITEKRTAIEVKIVNEQLAEMMADVLRRGVHALLYDPDFVAGKKLTKRAMEQREKELDQAGEELLGTFEKEPVAKVVQYTPSGVELFHPPTNDGWDNLLVRLAMFGFMMAMLMAFGCGFWVGTWWTRWTTTGAEQKSIRPREPETEPNPNKTEKHYVEGTERMTTGVNTKQPRQKKVRHMMCQAQCRYNQDTQTPRFQPLPEYAHGAFIG
ncbi:unnamed protein product [Prorocentrum cordatum]|uniref:Integrase catalytic domain-containing protein n=1 Tax=Prorocentrum cordatum TaxID=2364126 RepID=A0ABN9UU78_9DINO|nr:unnamed protein product [Polarella glacialis]